MIILLINNCRKYGMSERWDVENMVQKMFQVSFFRQTCNLSENWDVGEVKPIQKIYQFSSRFTFPTNVGIVGCLTCGMSRKWHAPTCGAQNILGITVNLNPGGGALRSALTGVCGPEIWHRPTYIGCEIIKIHIYIAYVFKWRQKKKIFYLMSFLHCNGIITYHEVNWKTPSV